MSKIESWLWPADVAPENHIRSRQVRWKGHLYASIFNSLVWWHPSNAIDDALEYYCESYERIILKGPHISAIHVRTTLSTLAASPGQQLLDPRLLDRYINAFIRTSAEQGSLLPTIILSLARLELKHPNHPNPDRFLWHMRDIISDPLHCYAHITLEKKGKKGKDRKEKAKLKAMYYTVTRAAHDILLSSGRSNDAEWVLQAFRNAFGAKSDMLPSDDTRSDEETSQWLNKWRAKIFPDFNALREELHHPSAAQNDEQRRIIVQNMVDHITERTS